MIALQLKLLSHVGSVRAITRELPDNIPFVVTEMFIHQVVARWETPAMQLFDYVEEILNKKIADFVHAECNQYPHLEFTISYVSISIP